mmetsp:Transcript_1140/g.2293  ORF Transcript_1140/g.2293 Transcript_1140/m.2293 type:complete len:260 (+) Transcript_1140:136-915(+)
MIFFFSFLKALDHFLDKLVDLFSSGTGFSSLHKVKKLGLGRESSLGVGKLEGPQEVVDGLEVGSNSVNLIDQVSSALDTNRRKSLSNDLVVTNGDTLLVDLSESTLPDELLDGLSGGVSVGDIRFNQSQHTNGSFVQTDKGSIVQLTKTEELHNLLGLGGDTNGTTDTDNKANLGLSRDVETTLGLGLAAIVNSFLLLLGVFSVVLFSVGDELLGVFSGLLFSSSSGGGGSISKLLLSGLLLQNGFRSLHLLELVLGEM